MWKNQPSKLLLHGILDQHDLLVHWTVGGRPVGRRRECNSVPTNMVRGMRRICWFGFVSSSRYNTRRRIAPCKAKAQEGDWVVGSLFGAVIATRIIQLVVVKTNSMLEFQIHLKERPFQKGLLLLPRYLPSNTLDHPSNTVSKHHPMPTPDSTCRFLNLTILRER